MAFEDRVVEYPNRWKLINPNDSTDFQVWDVERDEGEVTQVGTPLNAAAFNTCNTVVVQSFPSENVTGTVVIAQKLGFCMISAAISFTAAVSDWTEIVDSTIIPPPQTERAIIETVPYWSGSYTRPARVRIPAAGGLGVRYGAAGGEYCFSVTYPIE